MKNIADFIEFELSDPEALSEDYNFTDRAGRRCQTGQRLLMRGYFNEAAESFAQAARSDPSHYQATVALTETLITLGRTDEAAEIIDGRLNRYGRNAELGAARGHIFLHLDDIDNALECCDLAARIAPENAYAWLISGEVRLSVEGASWAAEDSFSQARSARDQWPHLDVRIALAYFEWGHFAAAINLLKHIAMRQPDLPLPWILLGDTHRALGQNADARQAYRRAAELVPELRSVQDALKLATRLKDHSRRFTQALSRFFQPAE